MEKQCFVIMPISDSEDYPSGHFGRVYEHLIEPACELAGFKPVRADDIMTTNYIALDVIKNILDSGMALCDLSSRNPNVLYELGIRQAFNLPVTLIKDLRTKRIFDIQGFRDIEYDESLRIDTVETAIEDLSQVIKNTYDNKSTEINSLISLLGIEPAKVSERKKISTDTEIILNSLATIDKRISQIETRVNPIDVPTQPIIVPIPENVGEPLTKADVESLKVGDKIYHIRFGNGEIIALQGNSAQKIVTIKFDKNLTRRMVINTVGQNFRKLK